MVDIPSFFKVSKTVWTSENFQNILLGNYVETDRQGQAVDSANLQDLKQTQAEKLVFKDADAFLEYLALLIQNQIEGTEGELLNDSSANYFFVQGKDNKFYSVLVRWESAQGLWRCGAYLQEELKLPNFKVFFPA